VFVIPAIDLLGGSCVRLHQGRFDQVTRYSDDPVAMARHWQDIGADWLHVVDLDGARAGEPRQLELVERIHQAVGATLEVGGGLRTMAAVDAALRVADRAVLGTAAVKDPDLIRQAVATYGNRVVVGIDARDGLVATDGWETASSETAVDVAGRVRDMGVETVIFTNIEVDATMAGPNLRQMQAMREVPALQLIASGGVGSVAHLRQLARLGVDGCIIGKALYEGAIDLARAIHEVQGPAPRYEN